MDSPIIDAKFIAQAWQADDRWHLFVREWYNNQTITFPEYPTRYVQTGFAAEAWEPLTDKGWRIESPEVHDGVGISVAVSPPVEATVTPVTDQAEHVFIRRCAARQVPAMAAMRHWRNGDRDPQEVAAAYHRTQTLFTVRFQVPNPRSAESTGEK